MAAFRKIYIVEFYGKREVQSGEIPHKYVFFARNRTEAVKKSKKLAWAVANEPIVIMSARSLRKPTKGRWAESLRKEYDRLEREARANEANPLG